MGLCRVTTIPRTRETERLAFRYQRVKRHPKYVYSSRGRLVHLILRVELSWFALDWDNVVRLDHPRVHVVTNCQLCVRMDFANMCDLPAKDAVLCAFCHGRGRNWGKHGITKLTMRQAKEVLACASQIKYD